MTPLAHERAAVLAAYVALPQTQRTALDLMRSGHSFQGISRNAEVPLVTVRRWVLHAVRALTQARLAATPGQPAGQM